MKRFVIAIILILAVTIGAGATVCKVTNIETKAIVQCYGDFIEMLGKIELTSKRDLIGKRENQDDYTGVYSADCKNESGKDVVFGGTSLNARKIHLLGRIETEKGSAVLRVRSGAKVKEYSPDENGKFDLDLKFGGSSYIVVCFDKFSGKIELKSEYLYKDDC